MMGDWQISSLEEVVKFIDYRGRTPQKTEDGMRLITAKNVKIGYLQNEPMEFVDPKIYDEWMTRGIPKKGDVLFTTEAPLGNVAQLDTDEKVVFAQRIIVMQPKREVLDSTFLKYMLLSNLMQKKIHEKGTGATVKGIKSQLLKKVQISFPRAVSEQKRIVAILDEAFEGIDRAIANTEKNLANSRELFESYLNAIFTQKGDGWLEKKLGDVCTFQGGSQPPKAVFSTQKKDGYIRLIQIRDYKSNNYTVYIPKKDARRFCQPDDVMIGRYGPPLFQILRGLEGAYNVALMKAIPNEGIILKDFLFYFLQNRKILNYIINSSSRTAGQTGLNKATIEPYPIVFPTLEQQAFVVSQLQEIKAETQRLEAIYCRKITALNELKQSILQKASTGELTADTLKTAKEGIAA